MSPDGLRLLCGCTAQVEWDRSQRAWKWTLTPAEGAASSGVESTQIAARESMEVAHRSHRDVREVKVPEWFAARQRQNGKVS